jgi:aspartate 1-decarboxylase
MKKILKAKLHGIRVTGAALDYHGSVTLDPIICAEVGIVPTEFVEIWNKNTGARLSTYVIYGEPASKCCVLNGAAARTCQVGDELIIASSEFIDIDRLKENVQRVLTFNPDNSVLSAITYKTVRNAQRLYDFSVSEEKRKL